MLVYHSSTLKIEHPDTQHSRNSLDFGAGFYLTTFREQAVRYAERFKIRGYEACLNTYELADDLSKWKILTFEKYDSAWLDFVTKCRSGNYKPEYDAIIGGIANDKVFRTLDLYFAGDINKDEALKRLVYENPNNQICIAKQPLIDECLTFIKSEKI